MTVLRKFATSLDAVSGNMMRPVATEQERGIHAASPFVRLQVNRLPQQSLR